MTGLLVGMVIGMPVGYCVHKAFVRRMWLMERAIRRRAQGR